VLRTLAAFRVRPVARNTRTNNEPCIDEAYLSAQQSASQADPWIPRAHGYQEGPAGAEPSACQGTQASYAVTHGGGVPIGSFTFSARQRLRTQAEFEHVYKSGQRFGQSCFQVTACGNTHGFPRLGLSIAARSVGNAVARNRIRRVVRETFRLAQHDLPAVDIVVAARSAARAASSAALRGDLEQALSAVRVKCAPSSKPSSTPTGG
jgi:ribonuclease P protein component